MDAMGLYDTIGCISADEAQRRGFTCAAGHALLSLQSKEFDVFQEHFLLGHDKLWIQPGGTWQEREPAPSYEVEHRADGVCLIELRACRYRIDVGRSGDFVCYNECRACPPALTLSLGVGGGLSIFEHWPVARCRLTIKRGALEHVE